MTAGFIVFLLCIVIPLVIAVVYYVRRCDNLRLKLDNANERRREISSFLTRFSTGIQGENGVDGAMQAAALHVAEQTDAESVAIYDCQFGELVVSGVCGAYPLVHSSNKLLFTRHRHLFEALRHEKIKVGEGFAGKIAETRHPELVPDASMDERFTSYPERGSIYSVMAIPLVREGILSGVVCAVNNRQRQGRPFSNAQFERMQFLTGQLIMVQNLVQVYTEISRRERIDQELEFARHLQLSLLPEEFPRWSPFSINAFSRSAKEVNGDFYDFVKIDEDRLLVVVGDACGKGIPACMLTAMTRSFVHCLVDNYTSLSHFLKEINTKLHRGTAEDRFITLGCCVLDRKNSLIEFGRAGHTDMVNFIHNHIRVFSPDGTALGILPDEFADFDTICLAFEPGSTIMLYSDGLSEAIGKDGEEFGMERLLAVFKDACGKNASAQIIIDEIMTAIGNFETEQNDDQTIILIRHDGSKLS